MSSPYDVAAGSRKRVWVVLAPLLAWGVLVFVVIWPWVHRFDDLDLRLSVLAHLSAFIWWLVLLWALHHLSFQLGALLWPPRPRLKTQGARPPVAILYTTCDDFVPAALLSCVTQKYESFRVIVCDDSRQQENRDEVRRFCAGHPRCEVVTRDGYDGFKAGNLNHAVAHAVPEEWFLLADADEILPPEYLARLTERLPADAPHVAFVQAAHEAIRDPASPFQKALGPEVALYYTRDLALRETSGFVPLLGHGALIRREAWAVLGGFPEIVSEDFAFALRAAHGGWQARYVRDVVSAESFPYDFGGFSLRLNKFAAGTAELFRRERIFRGGASAVEKWDFLLMLLWYVLMPLVTLNGFLGAYVCHRLWAAGRPYLHPVLPYLYLWLLLATFALQLSAARRVGDALRFYFWATAVYTAAMPPAALAFVKHLLFARPTFRRTPKNQQALGLRRLPSVLMIGLGAAAAVCALTWPSPYSPLLLAQGAAYLSYPLYGRLCRDSLSGKVARVVVYVPGCLVLAAVYAMWVWGRY